jgi:hypothetical protein
MPASSAIITSSLNNRIPPNQSLYMTYTDLVAWTGILVVGCKMKAQGRDNK